MLLNLVVVCSHMRMLLKTCRAQPTKSTASCRIERLAKALLRIPEKKSCASYDSDHGERLRQRASPPRKSILSCKMVMINTQNFIAVTNRTSRKCSRG